jgi:flagellar biosynthesis/type III secretory pathway chaperone
VDVNSIDKTVVVLCRHLDSERQCLLDLAQLLDDEAGALRRMALVELEEFARRKEVLLNEQRTLARERHALLATVSTGDSPISIADVIAMVPDGGATQLGQLRGELLALADTIKTQNQRNQTFAKTGHGLVTGLFRILGLGRSNSKSTYSANGRISGHLLARSNSRSMP